MKQGWQGLIIKPIILYLGLKKSRISRGIITVRRPCDQEFYSIGCCDIEELISFRLTHQILQIPAETLSFWRLNFFNPDEARLLEVCFWCWFSAMKRYKVLYCQLYYIYSYLHFYNTFPPWFYTYSNLCKIFSYIIQQSKNLNIVRNYALN